MPESTDKPPTVRQQIEDVTDEVRLLTETLLADRREREAAKPSVVPEAATIADCVRALSALKAAEDRGRSSSLGFPQLNGPTWPAGERVLRFLADRFGIALVDVKVEQAVCNRNHVDDLTPSQVIAALNNPAGVSW